MKVTVLGSNGPFPAAGGACSSYLIEDNGTKILADAGSGSLSNLMKLYEPDELDAIFLSHLHWDHMTDIPVLFYYLHVMGLGGKDIKNIPIYLPATPAGIYETLSTLNKFEVNILDSKTKAVIKGVSVSTKKMTHPVESYALKFESDNKTLVYSGDTTPNEELAPFAAGSDLLITDSAFLDNQLKPTSPHMSAAQCAGIAADAGVKRLMLSHLNPYTMPEDYLKEAKSIFNNTFTAEIMVTTEV